MKIAAVAASMLLAVCFAASSYAASDNPVSATTPAPAKKKASHPLKPTWEKCFDMSITRGFNHDTEEWQQSIKDCQAGKIPL